MFDSSQPKVGCMAYYDESSFKEDTKVDITILTKNIKKVFKTTKELASRLQLYDTEEEQYENLTYFNALLNYALVDMEDTRTRGVFGVYIGDSSAQEFRDDLAKIVVGILAITRSFFKYCNI